MEEVNGTGDPTQQDLNRAPGGGNTITVSSGIALSPIASASADRIDQFDLLLPFGANNFTYNNTGKLHIWITLAAGSPSQPAFEVDATSDGGGPYAMQYTVSGPGNPSVYLYGSCPMLGLMPSAAPTAQQPLLRVHGEPWIGQDLEVLLTQSPSGLAFLAVGSWQPFALPGTCNLHVGQASLVLGSVDTFGFAHWRVTVPNNPNFVHDVLGLQAGLAAGAPFSNALKVTIGGGL